MNLGTRDNARRFSGAVSILKEDLRVLDKPIAHELPRIGSIILVNENIEQMYLSPGVPSTFRTIALVKRLCGQNNSLFELEVYVTPTFKTHTSIPVSDFRVGLVLFQELKQIVYTRDFCYSQLDIRNPDEELKKLFKDNN